VCVYLIYRTSGCYRTDCLSDYTISVLATLNTDTMNRTTYYDTENISVGHPQVSWQSTGRECGDSR
jgi:hypothetical protein